MEGWTEGTMMCVCVCVGGMRLIELGADVAVDMLADITKRSQSDSTPYQIAVGQCSRGCRARKCHAVSMVNSIVVP